MQRCIFLLLSCFLCLGSALAKTRKFTNNEGKSITAELIGLEMDKAVFKLRNSRIAKIPLDTLAESDQKFINSWWEENKNKIGPMDLKMTIEKKTTRLSKTSSGGGNKGRSKKGQRGAQKTTTKDETQYVCQLKSYAKKNIPELTAKYTIYKRVTTRDKSGFRTITRGTDGQASIPAILPHGKTNFTTIRVTCEDVSQKAGQSGKKGKGGKGGNTSSSYKKETIVGLVVTLSVDGKEFLKKSYPDTFLDRLKEEAEIEERKFRDDS